MEDNEIKIEKGIPVPLKLRKLKYPFREMRVGDSFFIKYKDLKERDRLRNIIHPCASRHKPKKFITRTIKEESGIRCWRIE